MLEVLTAVMNATKGANFLILTNIFLDINVVWGIFLGEGAHKEGA